MSFQTHKTFIHLQNQFFYYICDEIQELSDPA